MCPLIDHLQKMHAKFRCHCHALSRLHLLGAATIFFQPAPLAGHIWEIPCGQFNDSHARRTSHLLSKHFADVALLDVWQCIVHWISDSSASALLPLMPWPSVAFERRT